MWPSFVGSNSTLSISSVFRLVQCTWLHFSPPLKELESRVLEVVPPPTWLSVVKQVGQLSLIFLSRMYYRSSPQVWSSYYQPAWIGVLIALSVFSIYSDLFIDWNLGISNWLFGAPTVTTQIFTGARRWWYYGFIVLDIFFRVSWAWRFSDLQSIWLPFALSLVEIFRRAMWFPLRIEGWQVSLSIGPRGAAAAGGVIELPPTVTDLSEFNLHVSLPSRNFMGSRARTAHSDSEGPPSSFLAYSNLILSNTVQVQVQLTCMILISLRGIIPALKHLKFVVDDISTTDRKVAYIQFLKREAGETAISSPDAVMQYWVSV
ncbi:hypothetical protein C5167_006206 [Papaver somniferum]|uniref:EXS domain-containing protein n=1 Tax=Papaver somniferum TaxID=3469 RepID=A0A4Y7JDL9_PAPSO|nr:hypothetical protein C5167_006206 [Papaver somniferum]